MRGASSLAEKSILLVNTSLDSLRKVCVRLREASARVRESDTMPDSSNSMGVAAGWAFVAAVAVDAVEANGAVTTTGTETVALGTVATGAANDLVCEVVCVAELLRVSSPELNPLSFDTPLVGVEVTTAGCNLPLLLCTAAG